MYIKYRFDDNVNQTIKKLAEKNNENLKDYELKSAVKSLISTISANQKNSENNDEEKLKNHLNIIIQLCKVYYERNISNIWNIKNIDITSSVNNLETSIIEALLLSNRLGHFDSESKNQTFDSNNPWFKLKDVLTRYIVEKKDAFEKKGIKLYKHLDETKSKNKNTLDIVQRGYPLVSVHISQDTVDSHDFRNYSSIDKYPFQYPPKNSPGLYEVDEENIKRLFRDRNILFPSNSKFYLLNYLCNNTQNCNDLILFNTFSVMGLGLEELEKIKEITNSVTFEEENKDYKSIRLSLKGKKMSIDKMFEVLNIPSDKDEFKNVFKACTIDEKSYIYNFIVEYCKYNKSNGKKTDEITRWKENLYNCYDTLDITSEQENFKKLDEESQKKMIDLAIKFTNYYLDDSSKSEEVQKQHEQLCRCYGRDYHSKYIAVFWDTKLRQNFDSNRIAKLTGNTVAKNFFEHKEELKKLLKESGLSTREINNIFKNFELSSSKRKIKKATTDTLKPILTKDALKILNDIKPGNEKESISEIIKWEKNQTQSQRLSAKYPERHKEIVERLSKLDNIKIKEEYFAQYLDWKVISSINSCIEDYYSDESDNKRDILKILNSSDRKMDANSFKQIYRFIKEDEKKGININFFREYVELFEKFNLQNELPEKLTPNENISIEDQIKQIAESSEGFKNLSEVGKTISRIQDNKPEK